jgi:zinc/manganese transport system ATP-binding protein
MSATPLVELTGVSLERGGRRLLRDINLRVAPREFILLRGPNGAGKTTLFETITGFATPTAGQVRVAGLPMDWSNRPALRRWVGYLPQQAWFDTRIPIRAGEFAALAQCGGWGTRRGSRRGRAARLADIAAYIGITPLLDRPLAALSGGELQKVAIARILLQEPQLILMDEPMNHLDRSAREQIARLLARVNREQGLAVILVSHQADEPPAAVTRLLHLADGRLADDRPLAAAGEPPGGPA